MRTETIALLAVMVGALFLGGTALFGAAPVVVPATHAGGATQAAPSPLFGASPHPLVGNLSNLTVVVNFGVSFPTYVHLPFNVIVTGNWANGTNNGSNTWINLEVRDVTNICEGGLGTIYNCPTVVNISMNSTETSGSTSWNTTLTSQDLQAAQFRANCPAGGAACPYDGGILPNDQFQILGWVTSNNSVVNESFSAEATAYLITTNPSATLVSPAATGDLSTGNVTVGIQYSGSYISGASINVHAGNATGTDVYSQSLFNPGVGTQTVISPTTWYAATPGAYVALIQLSTPYGESNFTTALTVVAAGSTVYHNSSSWSNSTLIPGLSSAAAGTLLLVVGLIIGMIVAFMLGMMMWGGTSKAAPAQPWQQAKTANECSVCHQSFATDAELKEHAKTAHGIT